jgi:hypothetical protein
MTLMLMNIDQKIMNQIENMKPLERRLRWLLDLAIHNLAQPLVLIARLGSIDSHFRIPGTESLAESGEILHQSRSPVR